MKLSTCKRILSKENITYSNHSEVMGMAVLEMMTAVALVAPAMLIVLVCRSRKKSHPRRFVNPASAIYMSSF